MYPNPSYLIEKFSCVYIILVNHLPYSLHSVSITFNAFWGRLNKTLQVMVL